MCIDVKKRGKGRGGDGAAAEQASSSLAHRELTAYRLYVAEAWVQVPGLREQTKQIMGTVRVVKDITHEVTLRVESIVENRPNREQRDFLI